MLRITSPFGNRLHPILTNADGTPVTQFHNGIDLAGSEKFMFLTTEKVQKFSFDKDNINGNKLRVHLDGGFLLIICHLEYISKDVVKMAENKNLTFEGVKATLPLFLGKMGSTGRSTGPHYHISIYRIKDKTYLNPTTVYKNLLTFKE